MGSELFLKIPEGSDTFSNDLCSFWSCSESLLWILKGSWRFWGILWCSGVLREVLRNCHRFWIFQTIYGTFTSVFCCSRVIWGVCVGSERFHKVLCHLLDFHGCSEAFWNVLIGSEFVWKDLEHSTAFFDLLWCSEAFWGFLTCFHRFWTVLTGSWWFLGVLWRSGIFWGVWGIFMSSELF